MALKIKSISGIEDIVVSFADSANNVPATGIVGLETAGSITASLKDNKLILSGENTDLSNYYIKTETSGKEELSSEFSSVYNNIAKEYDPNKAFYPVGSLVMHDNQLYQAKYNTQSGEFNPIYWNATNIANKTVTRLTIYPDAGSNAYPPDKDMINAIQSRSLIVLSEEVPGSMVDHGRPQDIFVLYDGYISNDGRLNAKFVSNKLPNDYSQVSSYYPTPDELNRVYGPETYEYSIDLKTDIPGVWTKSSVNMYSTDSNDECLLSLFGYSISTGQTGDYVEHSELTCKIGSGNTGTSTAVLIQGKNNKTLGQCALVQGENNIAGYYSFAQGTDNIAGKGSDYPNYAALAQGWGNTAENYSLAQGNHCSATSTAFAQGDSCSADNYSFAQGSHNIAKVGASFAQGTYVTANNFGVSFGNKTSSYNFSFIEGSNASATDWSLGLGQNISAFTGSFAQGKSISAITYSLAQGDSCKASNYSIVQGQYCTAYMYSFAQGGWNCSAYNQSIAQGTNCSAKDQSFAQGENCTSLAYSFAQGKNNYASYSSLAQGGGNSAINGSVAVGISNSASDYSFAGGSANSAKNYNFTYGVKNYLYNNGYSIVVGSANSATGPGNNIIIGASNNANGGNNVGGFIFGRNNYTHNDCSIALGSATSASQEKAVAIGTKCSAAGIGTIAIGSAIMANQQGQITIGTYNIPEGQSAKFVVGIGTGDYGRKNGFIVTDNAVASAGDFVTSGGYKLSDISAVLELLNNKPTSGQPYMIGLDASGNLTWLAV